MSKKPPTRPKQVKMGGQHDPKQCNHTVNGEYIHHKPHKAKEGKETIKVYDSDGTRELIVPNRKPIDRPVIMATSEFERLKKQAHVITLEDRMQMIAEAERKKAQLQLESDLRKDQLIKSQKQQNVVPGSKLDTVETEAVDKNLYVLQRSKELMIEQDDRAKVANSIILAAKCRAIRNAQIAEKQVMEHQLAEENKRLDMMMEQQRQKLIQIEEEKRERNEKKKDRYVKEVKQQIKANEMERLREAERIEEESKMLNKALVEMQKEEEEKMRQKMERQLLMREEFRKANEEAEHYRHIREEEQRIADLRVQEFMRQKAEREEAREKELALTKAAKELEIARLRAQQQKSKDIQAALDEMNALRWQEEKEKEWREKEKAAALKHLEMNKELRVARAKQIEDIRKAQAIVIARDEEDFLKVAKVQKELYEKDLEEQKKKREQTSRHRKELLKQINEKERERINWQQEKFHDGQAQRLEYEVKDRDVEDYLKKKIEKLKDTSIPEPYIADIERQLKLTKN